ncbi:hypothetical protein RB195_024801 [Necator americanus]|uniref:Retrotransposon gag domain-containing protein n=1 Tax=Necator americanus TaxID=51031 RepID=A0ABR1ERT7_NECAM
MVSHSSPNKRDTSSLSPIGNIMGLTEHTMVRRLPAHLKGVAKAVFDSITNLEKQDWRCAVSKLQQHFSTEHHLDLAREKLMDMKMDPSESPIVFSNRIRRNILDAYPNNDYKEKCDFLQTAIFTNGLLSTIKQKLKLLGPFPSDYNQLLTSGTYLQPNKS